MSAGAAEDISTLAASDPVLQGYLAAKAREDWPAAAGILRDDSTHRGAHEYIGEAYLMVGNLAKAKEHLGALDKLCFFPCQEYSDLKKAIAEYEKKGPAK